MMQQQERDGLTLAHHYLDIGNDHGALAALEGVGDDALARQDYWYIRTTALRRLERGGEAVDAARRGLELHPESIQLLDSLALAELERDRLDAAEVALDRALELAPGNAVLHAHLALTLARSKQYSEARAHVDRALALDPQGIQPLRVRAQVAFLARENPATIRAYIADLLELAPNDQIGHALLGSLSAREKDFVQSARELGESARIDPSNRKVAAGARQARVYAHPVLAPVRPVWKFGRWRAYFVFIALSATLAAAHQTVLRAILIGVWLCIVALSWLAPPIVRRLQRRKYGG